MKVMILMITTFVLFLVALGIVSYASKQRNETLNRIDRLRRVVESKVTTLYVQHRYAETEDEKLKIEQVLSKLFLRSSKLICMRWEVKNKKKIAI